MATKVRTIGVAVDDALVDEIKGFRRLQPDFPSAAETLRRLIRLGLAHSKQAGAPETKSAKA
jgi:hypothetical protein